MIILYKEGVSSLLSYQYRPINVVLDDQDPDSGIPFTSDGAFLRLSQTSLELVKTISCYLIISILDCDPPYCHTYCMVGKLVVLSAHCGMHNISGSYIRGILFGSHFLVGVCKLNPGTLQKQG